MRIRLRSPWFAVRALAVLVAAGCAAPGPAPKPITVSDVTLFGEMDCYRIETASAIYVFGKRGAGFASILDPEGKDWISFHPGGKAAGEYRGLPKCGQPVKYFHCGYGYGQYRTDAPFTTRVTLQEPDHVRITSETGDGASASDWDFRPTYATLTLRRIALPTYWFLYEGAPGGQLDAEHDQAIRPGGKRTPLSEAWEDQVPWTCVTSSRTPYALLLISHEPQAQAASYVSWPYAPDPEGGYRQMTILGWGRPGWKDPAQHQPQFRSLPARFSIALIRETDEPELDRKARDIRRMP
ncbi:MAG TPA: hypothetical protein VKW04_04775 [Planctomycetota bacterium]|nr:hypothetical protein [Planctomycetota bacterium]